MTKPEWQSDLPGGDVALPADALGGSAAELADQGEIDALLRLQAGDLAVPAGLARRIRLALWHRRLRVALEWTAAAVIVIGLTVCYARFMSRPTPSITPATPSSRNEAGRHHAEDVRPGPVEINPQPGKGNRPMLVPGASPAPPVPVPPGGPGGLTPITTTERGRE